MAVTTVRFVTATTIATAVDEHERLAAALGGRGIDALPEAGQLARRRTRRRGS